MINVTLAKQIHTSTSICYMNVITNESKYVKYIQPMMLLSKVTITFRDSVTLQIYFAKPIKTKLYIGKII